MPARRRKRTARTAIPETVALPDVTTPGKALLDAKGAAEYLSLAKHTLDQWRADGKGPRYTKLGGAIRYRIADLDAFIEAGLRSFTRKDPSP
jgi:predicted DNA-binding transcriptional regulator AlpA